MKILLSFFFFLFIVQFKSIFSQTKNFQITLLWEEQKNNRLPFFHNAGYNGSVPCYFQKVKSSYRKKYQITNIDFESKELEKKYHKFYDLDQLPTSPTVELSSKSAKKQWYENLFISTIFNKNGKFHKIISINIDANEQMYINQKAGIQVFAQESVLKEGTGDWYKLRVTNDGIQKISYSMLSDMGVDVANLNPKSINIYGNAQGMLPIQNNKYRPDDLIKNSIYIQGDTDGVFNSNDYILFYGKGADKTYFSETQGMQIETNIYSDYSCYFLNINPNNISPSRISQAVLSNQTPTITVVDFDDIQRHENDLENIGRVGQRWYGEKFDEELNQSFNFTFPNAITSDQYKISTAFLGASKGGIAKFDLYTNGVKLTEIDVSGSTSNYTVGDRSVSMNNSFKMVNDNVNVGINFNRSIPLTNGWLDFIEIKGKRALKMVGGQMIFRNTSVKGIGTIAKYEIRNSNLYTKVWDVSKPTNPKLINGDLNNQTYSFVIDNDTIKEFVVFNGGQFFEPVFDQKIEYQNLHALPQADLLIVTHKDFLSQANRLADIHREVDGLKVNVATTEQIFNEFSSGMIDPVAIKQFAKMFYDRAELNGVKYPKNLCLFGDGSYDPKNRIPGNNYYVPVYEFEASENQIAGMVADQFFGILDDNESISSNDLMDIGVGRILASSQSQAINLVNKIEQYLKNGSNHFPNQGDESGYVSGLGDWKNKVLLIADDEENHYFPKRCELAYDSMFVNYPELNIKKIYLEAFPATITSGGKRYPQVNQLINRNMDEGVLLVNYVGHGREIGLATERIVTIPMINNWDNIGKLSTLLSSTCEFGRFDDPTRISGGELCHLNPKGGMISLFSTTRAVYYGVNDRIVEVFYKNAFETDNQGNIPSMGELLMKCQNQTFNSGNNRRSFTLFGDPALRFAVPKNKVIITEVNGHPINSYIDTLKALDYVKMKGYIANFNGVKLNNYNGFVYPEIFDKVKKTQTLGNISPVYEFDIQNNVIYKGNVSVKNGEFEFDFIVPLDIDYNIGFGKISSYSYQSNYKEAWGGDYRIKVGGINPNTSGDDKGPDVILYMNSSDFINGGLTDETPFFIAEVFDESGINTVGNGIGHDITLILDANTSEQIILNNYYESDLDTYKSGKVRYRFDELSEGDHTLTFKVWDVNNNSTTATLDFVVHRQEDVEISHVYNYPNPFTTKTKFIFEHNQVARDLNTQIQIFTVSGRLVKTINESVKTDGFRVQGIEWDGKDDFGDKMGRGVYVYKVIVTNEDGSKAEKLQKLVLL